jgi:hypothetical protein
MNTYGILFQLASQDNGFLLEDDLTTLLTMETNRLELDFVPDLYGDKISFAKGYVMAREKLGRDPNLPEGVDRDYDLGYDRGLRAEMSRSLPHWDQRSNPS